MVGGTSPARKGADRRLLSSLNPAEPLLLVVALRASLIAAGATAESPARLDAEAEQLAREERWT